MAKDDLGVQVVPEEGPSEPADDSDQAPNNPSSLQKEVDELTLDEPIGNPRSPNYSAFDQYC